MISKKRLNFIILTVFPEIFSSFISTSLIAKAIESDIINIELINFRDYAEPPHYKVDDIVYGGGAGMLLKPEPLAKAIQVAKTKYPNSYTILLSASGKKLTQRKCENLSEQENIILICGRYEGVDQRVIDLYVDEEIRVGDFVTLGGEVPSMLLIEATTRLIDNVIGNSESLQEESFSIKFEDQKEMLEGPQYTRPIEFNGLIVPEVLRSGDHKKIANWRKEQSLLKTNKNK